MNYKTTIILAAVVGALVLFTLLIPRLFPDLDVPDDPSPDAGALLPTFGKDEVARIELHWPQMTTTITRRDGEWWLGLDEVQVPADAARVDDLLDPLQGLRPERSLEDEDVTEQRLRTWGLDPARGRIVVTEKEGSEHELLLGQRYRPGSIYARAGKDGRIAVISDAVLQISSRDPKEFRARRPVRLKAYEVTSLVVEKGGEPVLRARLGQDDLAWRLRIGEREVPGDRESIEDLRLAASEDLEVLEEGGFAADAPEDLAPFGLAEPEVSVTVVGEEGARERTILIGAVDEESKTFHWMIRGEPSVYRSSTRLPSAARPEEDAPGLPELVSLPVDHYRDRSLLRLGAFAAPELVAFSRGPATVRMVRKEEVWSFEVPEGRGPVETAHVNTFIDEVREMNLVRYADGIPDAETGFTDGADDTARLEIRLSDGGGEQVFRVGKVLENGDAYLRREAEDDVVVAPAAFLEKLGTPWFRFRRLAVYNVPRITVQRVDVYRTVEGVKKHEAVVRDGNDWKAAEGMEGEAVGDAVRDLVAHLDPLKAEEFVAFGPEGEPVDAAAYGLEEPVIQVQATLKEGETTKVVTLDLGAEQKVDNEVSIRFAQLTVDDPILDGLIFTLGQPQGGQPYWKVLGQPLLK